MDTTLPSAMKYKVDDEVISTIPLNPGKSIGPGWNPEMNNYLGKIGIVQRVEICHDDEYMCQVIFKSADGTYSWWYLEDWLVSNTKENLKLINFIISVKGKNIEESF